MTKDHRESEEKAGPEGAATEEHLVYDRREGALVREVVLGDRLLRGAYLGPFRRVSGALLFRHAFFSRLLGWFASSPLSRRKIAPAIEELGIDVEEFRDAVEDFRTFNDFFCRHLRADARPYDESADVLCSPADCRMTVYPELSAQRFVPVKGRSFTLSDLVGAGHEASAAPFAGGALAVCRLCPADYHRFHYPASGRTLGSWVVPGYYHSVNPLVLNLGLKVFTENRRICSLLEYRRFGPSLFVEVGAFAVASIVQTHDGDGFEKMDEKGMFRFGGSTLILVFEPGAVCFDADLCERTRAGIETLVRCGETIGRAAE